MVEELYERADPQAMPLADRGYVAGVHPLELWLVGYLRRHPGAGITQVLRASSAERQAVYGWLFMTLRRNAQDKRIASLLEIEAFLELHRGWERLGYPVRVPHAVAGHRDRRSGDRPAALAELMGIILNDGLRYPTVLVDRLDFAAGTPYETRLSRAGAAASRCWRPRWPPWRAARSPTSSTQGTARGLRARARGATARATSWAARRARAITAT